MTIAIRGTSGAPNFAINSVTPTIPTAQVTGDMMLLIAVGKPFDAGWSVATAGWNALGSAASGSTAAGVDVGSMKAQVWYKEATSDTETNPTLTEGSPAWNVIGAHIIVLSKDVSEIWDTPVVVYGADETSGTAVSVTFASDPGVTAGDYVVCFFGSNSDALGPTTTNIVCTQTGVTFGTVTEHGDAETTSGGDMMLNDVSIPVSSGTGSAAPAMTATGTASGGADRLEAGFIRLRVAAVADARVDISWAEFEVPTANSRVDISWAEFEVPTANSRVDISWAELEVPTANTRVDISWAELQVPDLVVDARVDVSFAELEVPALVDARVDISWAELEVPTADARVDISWSEFETPNAPGLPDARTDISWAELEVPTPLSDARIDVSWTELEVPSIPAGGMTDPEWVRDWRLEEGRCMDPSHNHYPHYPYPSEDDEDYYSPVSDA